MFLSNPLLSSPSLVLQLQQTAYQNVILTKQVCNLARQNVSLREKIIKMSSQNINNFDDQNRKSNIKGSSKGILDVGYAKGVAPVKDSSNNNNNGNIEKRREHIKKQVQKQMQQRKQTRQANTTKHKYQSIDQIYTNNNNNNKSLDRIYLFGRFQREQQAKNINYQKRPYSTNYKSMQKQKQRYSNQDYVRPRQEQKRRVNTQSKQPRFTYLSSEQKQEHIQSNRKSQPPPQYMKRQYNKPTIIQSLNQQSSINPQLRSRIQKNILRIQSQAYNESTPHSKPQANTNGNTNANNNNNASNTGLVKKTNQIYLFNHQSPAASLPSSTYSPISKLKSIKRFNQSNPSLEIKNNFSVNKVQTQNNVNNNNNNNNQQGINMSKKKTIGSRKYLSLISDVYQSIKNQGKKNKEKQQPDQQQEQQRT